MLYKVNDIVICVFIWETGFNSFDKTIYGIFIKLTNSVDFLEICHCLKMKEALRLIVFFRFIRMAPRSPFTCIDIGAFLMGVIPAIPCMIITVIIIYKSLREIPKLKKLNCNIKFQYYCNCALSLLTILNGAFVSTIGCDERESIENTFLTLYLFLYTFMLIGILDMLLLRLHHTFKETAYRITSAQSWIIMITAIMLIIFAIIVSVLHGLYLWTNKYAQAAIIMFGFLAVTYISLTIYCMYLFAQKLLILANLRATSMRNVHDHVQTQSAIKLNKSQTKIINQAARYMSLTSLAMISSIITFMPFFFRVNYLFLVGSYFDCMVNVICLFLQFAFATRYYDKYCGCLKRFWNKRLSIKAEKNMERKYRDSIHATKIKSEEMESNADVDMDVDNSDINRTSVIDPSDINQTKDEVDSGENSDNELSQDMNSPILLPSIQSTEL